MKFKILSLLLAIGMLIPVTASAFTVRELSDVAWIATYRTTPNANGTSLQLSPLIDSHGVTAEYVDDTHIRFNGILGYLDFVFTLCDGNGNATSDGYYLCINNTDYAINVSASEYASQQWQMLQCQRDGTDKLYNNICGSDIYRTRYVRSNEKFLFQIARSGDGYKLVSTTPLFIHGSADETFWDYYLRLYDEMEMESFIPNAIMHDNFIEKYNYTGSTPTMTSLYAVSPEHSREYPVRVELDYTNNRFTILNFGNNGYGLREQQRYYLNNYNNSYNSDGKVLIAGSLDSNAKKLTFDKNQYTMPIWTYYNAHHWLYGDYIKPDMFICRLQRFDQSKSTAPDELYGTYIETGNVRHNSASSNWVSHGGKRRTYEGISMDIDDFTYYMYDASNTLYRKAPVEGSYRKVHIDEGDVTLQTSFVRGEGNGTNKATAQYAGTDDPLADVKYTEFTGGDASDSENFDGTYEWGIVPVINVDKNEKYVESYEVMAVPGTYNTASEIEQHLDEAVNFRRIFTNDGTKLTAGNSAVFNADEAKNGLYKPGDFRIARKNAGFGPDSYTFFIKANYKPETNLAPTYHDVYPYTFTAVIPTNVDVIGYSNVKVKGLSGCLTIESNGMEAAVYDIAGAELYRGYDASINVPAGTYIVKIGRKAYKTIVK